ncbi:TonB-dependent receptor [Flavobacterium sp.]|uniref:SusC/RagA family TonB-linked outer membrane protein n=1 Tax=Flavobacterium sp. TaxID=239 RepID=UPI00121BBFE2|nr:TonB-dependent receptor [Flavobacterium sp.]RZJ70314.1 MAG: TonB-dependent receptor [Flavobacterium sp.]
MKFKKVLFFCISALLFSFIGHAQNIDVKGKVTDETGLPVPGTTVTVKGTQTATMTDIDGNYQISAPSNGTLVYSFIGYTTLELAINGQAIVNANIKSASENLDEVVVVGYGTQKKSVVTGAISKVRAQDLENQPVTRVEQSLQGRTSGVVVAANAGQPGSAATVRVRGITTLNDNNPLYVVDGILVDASSVQYINQYDIESMEVLKDASASVYGTRAAGGVIVITTKKGKSGKLSVNYNGFAGFQEESRRVGVLNATQYATLRNEAYLNGGGTPSGIPFANPQSYGRGTDWQDQIFQNAMRESHDLSISGGTDKSTFYASFSLIDQEGIVLPGISRYQRKTFRLNSEHKVTKYIRFGQTASYTHEKNVGIGNTNSEFGGPLASAINLDPITPVLEPNPDPSNPFYSNPRAVRNDQGVLYGISPYVANEISNPLAYERTRLGNFGWADNFTGNAYIEIEPITGLKFRTTASGKQAYYGSQSFTPEYYLTSILSATENNFSRDKRSNFYWSVENTLSYTKSIKDHNFAVLLGQGSYVWEGEQGQGTTFFNLPIDSWQDASFNFPVPIEDQTTFAYTSPDVKLTSLFARLTYDFKEKYLLSALIRRDGSSKFGENNKFGNFPSISIGWVPTKESFWPENKWVTQLKIRGSYGVAGNDRTGDFGYASLVNGGYNYQFGPGGAVTIGNTVVRPANPNLKWEETTNRNIAADITVLGNINLTVDVFNKKTTGILRELPIPGYVGLSSPLANLGEVENKGVELEVGYRKSFGDFKVGFNGNISWIKNRINSIAPDVDFYDVANVQSSTYQISRNQVGESFGAFYGFVTDGIFQNQAEIDSYVGPGGTAIQPGAVPGDFRWRDLNNDGQINGDDRKVIGKPLPDYTYGVTLNLEYKNFDLSIFGQGVAGNQIYNGLRRLDLTNANWQSNAMNRWVGEGTSNSYPRVSTTDNNRNFSNPSTFYLEDGDYFRIKTVQVGYSISKDIISKAGLDRARIYVMSENLFTFTKYTGFDPEIGGNVLGIDRGYYPQARSFMMGVNLQF